MNFPASVKHNKCQLYLATQASIAQQIVWLYSLEGDELWLDYKVILLLYSLSQAAADMVQVLDTIQGWQVEVLQNQSAE